MTLIIRQTLSHNSWGGNEERGREVVDEMSKRGGSQHRFESCNAELISATRACAASISARLPRLDALVLTQGIASLQGRQETTEGLDRKLSLHYFSRISFVDSLLPLLRLAPSPRVLSVLTSGVHPMFPGYATDFELKHSYSVKAVADAACAYNDAARFPIAPVSVSLRPHARPRA